MPTGQLLNFLSHHKIDHSLDLLAFESAYNKAKKLFNI